MVQRGKGEASGTPADAESPVEQPVAGMEGAPVAVGPRGEIVVDNSTPDEASPGERTGDDSASPAERDQTAESEPTEPDTPDNHPSIAVNQEPSG